MDMNIEDQIERLFEELITHQQNKTLKTARDRLPQLTGDDILNPHDFPELMADPIFNYEEGLTASLMAAQFAVRRCLRALSVPTHQERLL